MQRTLITRRTALGAMAVAVGAMAAPLRAQPAYPTKIIRIVVPYPAGGGADALARTIGRRLGEELKQTVVIENKAGANGYIGVREATSAAPDGHTMVIVTDGLYSIAPHLLAPGAKDPLKDLAPVIQLVDNPLVIVARPGLGVENVAQLVALAKQKPGELTYAANNTTSTHFLATQVLMKQSGISMRHIPYAGAGQSVPDLVGGQLDLLVGSPTAVEPAVKAGRGVKYIGVTSRERFPGLPNVPPVGDTLPGFDQPAAMGLMITKGTPASTVALLNRTIQKILEEPEVRKIMIDVVGGIPVGGSPEAFQDLMNKQVAARAPLIKELGLANHK